MSTPGNGPGGGVAPVTTNGHGRADGIATGPAGPPPTTGATTGPDTGIRRLVLLALVLVVVGAGTGSLVTLLVPARYEGRAEVLYPIAVEQPTGFLREDRNLTTQVLLIGSRAVLQPVAAARGIAVEDLQSRLTVEVVDSSEIIGVAVRAPTREEGVALAGAITGRYLEIAAGTRAGPAREYVATELAATRRSLAGAPGNQNLRERERALVAQLDSLTTTALARPVPSVIVPPYAAAEPVGPGIGTGVAAGALVGTLVAAGIVLARAVRRTRGR